MGMGKTHKIFLLVLLSFMGGRSMLFAHFSQIAPPQTSDLATLSFLSPQTSCGLGPAELVSIQLANLGADTIFTFDACFSINGGIPVCNPVSQTLAPGDTVTFAFPVTADLALEGDYLFEGWIDLPGDINTGNDTISGFWVQHISQVGFFPYVQDFENGPGGWQGTGVLNSWQFGIPASTFISFANSGDNAFVTNLTGPYNNNEFSFLESPCFDFSGFAADPNLQFAHIYSTESCCDEGWIEVSVNGGATWAKLGQGGAGNNWYNDGTNQWWDGNSGPIGAWRLAKHILSGTAGQSEVRIRFVFRSDGSIQSDGFGVDDILIFDTLTDVGISSFLLPTSDCGLGNQETVEVQIANWGTDTLYTLVVCYRLNGGADQCDTLNFPFPPGVVSHQFTIPADLTSFMIHNLEAWTVLAGDLIPANDTYSVNIENIQPINSFPYLQNFDTWAVDNTNPVPLNSYWENAPGDGPQDWWINNGPTPSANTGPTGDHSTGTGNYLYLEDSGFDLNTVDLVSPCFDLNGVNACLNFWYHSNDANGGATQNSVKVQVFDGLGWVTLDTLRHNASLWEKKSYDLSGFSGLVIKIRFRGNNNNWTFSHDIAIDDFEVEVKSTINAGILSIENPKGNTCGLGWEEICVSVSNDGIDTLFGGIPVFYAVSGDTIAETLDDTLAPGDVVVFCFDSLFDFSQTGPYELQSWTALPGDTLLGNDTVTSTLIHSPLIDSFPYFENFESGAGSWYPGGSQSSWALGTPAKNTISGAASGLNCWVTGGLGGTYYNPGEGSWVNGPCFDFSGLSQPWIKFKIWYNAEFSWDGAVLQSSIDSGATWQNVGGLGDPTHWYNEATINGLDNIVGTNRIGWSGRGVTGNGSGGWLVAQNALTSLGGQPYVLLRVAFGSDPSIHDDGFAFDDIFIGEGPAELLDLGNDTIVCDTFLALEANLPPGTFFWSTGDSGSTISVNSSGLYSIVYTGANGFCSWDTIRLDFATPSSVSMGVNTNFCPLISFTGIVTAGNPTSWYWDFGDGTGTSTLQNPTYDYSTAGDGTYWVTLITTDSCGSDTVDYFLPISCLTGRGISNSLFQSALLYPNPTGGVFFLELGNLETGNSFLRVYDVYGKQLFDQPLNLEPGKNPCRLDYSHLASGIYLIEMISGNSRSFIKLVIE